MIADSLAGVLRSGRAEFNARFAEARGRFPDLDAAAFRSFLERQMNPLIDAVSRESRDSIGQVVTAAYDIGLGLVGEKLAGPGARHACINDGWQILFPQLAPHMARAPGTLLAALSNALHHLGSTAGARPKEWMELVSRHGPACGTVEQLLAVGKVAAWRSGLAHFRVSALQAADSLPEPLALALVGAAGLTWNEVRPRLAVNPWFDPSQASIQAPRVAGQAGAFRGFSGLFMEPPLVAAAGEHFLARAADECWLLTADTFGATFHRATLAEFEAAKRTTPLPRGVEVTDSRLFIAERRFEIPELGRFTSVAANDTTVAVTGADTHAIALLALP